MKLFDERITAPDPIYNNVRDGNAPMEIAARKLCEELWKTYEPYADKNFAEQLQQDFTARFWEMDLTCALIEKGYDVDCPKPGPDIRLEYRGSSIWIEAIAPTNGAGPDQVPEMRMGEVQRVPNDQFILRLTSAIEEKYTKYIEYLKKGIIQKPDPYVIAINGSRIDFAYVDLGLPRIVRAVFPIGSDYILLDRRTGKQVGRGSEYKPTTRKSTGTDIRLDTFIRSGHEGVSAILYSVSNCFNRPGITGADYILVHNLKAKNPMKTGFIQFGKEYVPEVSPEDENLFCLHVNKYNVG